ncbi:MAG: cytochrome c family protein [Planctomycetota bacterium]
MKARNTLLVGMLCIVVVYVVWQAGRSSAEAGVNPLMETTAAIGSAVFGQTAGFEYIGSTKCKKCHLPQYKDWEKLRHGTALETLKPGNKAEAKTKHKLDPAKDYTKDATCVGCHTVGLGKPGGYQIPADEEAAKKVKHLEGVGCEMCHGPASKYNEIHEEIMKSKRKYKVDELYAAGMLKTDKAVCLTCHNEKSPSVDASIPFDYDKMKEKGTHGHVPLKQRE